MSPKGDDEAQHIEKISPMTLGNVRLRDRETDEIILIPTPSKDPNDPLNWSQAYKFYIASIICLAMMMCNFLAAGPTIAIISTTQDFFEGASPATDVGHYIDSISKVSYFFTTTSLMQGLGNFFWVPIANKYGRRPTYIMSYVIYLVTLSPIISYFSRCFLAYTVQACGIWLCYERSYHGFLAGRIIMGFGAGAAETIAPITISDIFFLHERGAVMAFYTAFLSAGVTGGMLVSGLITINHTWRTIYQVASALIGFVLLLAIFTFPETAYIRSQQETSESLASGTEISEKSLASTHDTERLEPAIPAKQSYLESLKIFHQTLTTENLLKLIARPIGLICLPPVLWAALVQAVTIGFLVAVTSNVDVAFNETYGFKSWQVGLCFISGIIGALLGIPAGGQLGDKVADWFTKRNGGVRDPEMRLPAMLPSLITTPLALVLYGVGIEHKLHWMVPTVGLGLLNFSITQATNICLVYLIDAYRPVAGEITLAVMGFKALFGFLLSFYTNPWVSKSGYQNAYGTMAALSAAALLMGVPLYLWGKRIRHVSWQWPVISYIHWHADREVGE